MNLKAAIFSALVLGSGVATPVFSQVTDAPPTKIPPSLLKALRPMHLPSPMSASGGEARNSAPDAVAMGLASARVYRFASADFPGSASSYVFDENKSTVVGDANSVGFTLNGGVYELFTVPGSIVSIPTGINAGGDIVGVYVDISSVQHGFLKKAGVFTNIDDSGGATIPFGINDAGKIVGQDGSHGFFTNDGGGTFKDFDVPAATETVANGVNSAGVIVGNYTDSAANTHGFFLSGGLYTPIDFPLAEDTFALDINDSNEIAGYFIDTAGVNHGFIYSAGAYSQVAIAIASGTQLTRIKNNGHVTGAYVDSMNETHGLTGH